MNISITIPAVDSNGFFKADTGKTVTLRITPYASGDIKYTAIEVSGGDYIFNNVTTRDNYKLFVGDAEQTWFGVQRLGDLASDYMDLSTSQNLADSAIKNFRVLPTSYDQDDYPLMSTDPGQFINKAYADLYYKLIIGKSCIVDSRLSNNLTGHYKTIQDAINYINSLTPASGDKGKIYVFPHKDEVDGYVENITLQSYIDIIGIGMPKITGQLSGYDQTNYFENLSFYYTGSYALTTCHARRVNFVATVNIHYAHCVFETVGLFTVGGSVVSDADNISLNSWANYIPGGASGDKGALVHLDDITILPDTFSE
jgi:hypothetical protein